jgi:hypothetical protein
MFGLDQFFDDLLNGVQRSTAIFLGLLCLLVFAVNAGLLVWLIVRKSDHGLVRCPKCGRTIACPHCEQ